MKKLINIFKNNISETLRDFRNGLIVGFIIFFTYILVYGLFFLYLKTTASIDEKSVVNKNETHYSDIKCYPITKDNCVLNYIVITELTCDEDSIGHYNNLIKWEIYQVISKQSIKDIGLFDRKIKTEISKYPKIKLMLVYPNDRNTENLYRQFNNIKNI